eukprot:GEMP01007129.1.p1 GENE.GEMP01007129.1~~GEMP01007129.1.p1  ORF type:complete len:623 (+),score=97.13 GEMP01007129.1:80-1948(+)
MSMAWPCALEKRYKLKVPWGHIFVAHRRKHVQSNGAVDPPGVYQFAAVGFNAHEKKYMCIEAGEHEDGGNYNFVLFTEKQITEASAEGEAQPPRRFASVTRSLPLCDEKGNPIVIPAASKQNAAPTEWSARLSKRLNLQVPRCTLFIMPRMGRNQGKDEFLGDHEYAVVGYNGREEKYICIDAEDHQDASSDYTPHLFTEKQIMSARPAGGKPPAVRFAKIPRPLPKINERGQLITDRDIAPTSPPRRISGMPLYQPKRSSTSALYTLGDRKTFQASKCAYDEWPKVTKQLFELELDRGFTFNYRQTANKASVEMNRFGWLVKEWGLNGEEAMPGVYEYIIAGFDQRERRYLCFEAGNNGGLAVRMHHDDIVAAANYPVPATVTFGGRYPPLPEYDSRTLMVKGYDRPIPSEGGPLTLNPEEQNEKKPPNKKMYRECVTSPCISSSSRAFLNDGKNPAFGGQEDQVVAYDDTLEATAPYLPWYQASQSLYRLELPRGLLFTFEQTKTTASFDENHTGDWLIKMWGGNHENVDPGVYEYVIAGYYPREARYLCFEARAHDNAVVLFTTEQIKECLANPLPADYSFRGRYPRIADEDEDSRDPSSGRPRKDGGFRRVMNKFFSC